MRLSPISLYSNTAIIYFKEKKIPDIGFRVFKLDSSNLKIWDDSPITGENAVTEFERRLFAKFKR